MYRIPAIAVALITLLASSAEAQVIPVYGPLVRPPGIRYVVRHSRHFEVIHEVGMEGEATELASLLEDALSRDPVLFPPDDGFRMPVVLSQYTDRGNGYVSPVPFRQEIDAVPYSGLGVSPKHDSWLDTVGPHELVHGLQADFRAGFGIGGIVRTFAPDMARAMNLWVPPGISEGAAVYVESQRGGGAGRLHYGYYRMQYRAAAGSGSPWSLAEALEQSVYTRPTGRHYIGGGPFIEWFIAEYGVDSFRRVARVHNRFPILGYGFSMWLGTGHPPWSVGRAFRRHAVASEEAYRTSGNLIDSVRPLSGRSGMVHRRPRWIDDSTLVVFMTSYNRERGLYSVDSNTGTLRAIAHEELSFDLHFAVRDTEPRLSYSRYIVNPFASLQYEADIFTLNSRTGETRRLTRGGHLLSPAPLPDGRYVAVETSHRGGPIVIIETDGSLIPLLSDDDLRIVGVDVESGTSRILVVANRYGTQALWIVDPDRVDGPTFEFLVGLREGAILDASWTPGGDGVVFSADLDGKLDIYHHDILAGRTVRLTRSVYGAMEPAISFDGTRMAYVRYGPERWDLIVEPFSPSDGEVVSPDGVLGLVDLPAGPNAIAPGSPWVDAEAKPYRASGHLWPRMIYPTVYYEDEAGSGFDADLGFGGGLAIQGADPVLNWSYWGEGFFRKNRLWGEAGVLTSLLYTRLGLRLYDRPESVNVRYVSDNGSGIQRVIREERGAELGVSLPVVLSNNVRSSTISAGVGIRYEEQRLYDAEMRPLTDFAGRVTTTGSLGLALGVQRNLRDLVPNRGLVLSVVGKADLHANEVSLRQAVVGTADVYLPWLSRANVGIRIHTGWVGQSEFAVYDLDWFMPRGQEDNVPAWRSLFRLGAETIVPVAFVDNGILIPPIYVASVYLYGFGETVMDGDVLRHPDTFRNASRITSFGGGVGVQLRLFHALSLDLRAGAARRTNADDWTVIFR